LLPGSFFGGGMIGVGIAQIVDTVRGCKASAQLPACNTFGYFYWGGILGAVLMVIAIQWRLGGRRGGSEKQSERS
jgi:hypothetical protein